MSFRGTKIRQRCVPLAIQLVGEKRGLPNERACIGKEIDMIQVRRTAEHDSFVFEVVVREGNGETRHHVTMSREMCERLTAGKHTPERCLEAAFRFLLEREPKESILRRFDVMAISRYFPEFEREMPRYLSQF
jgi:Holliday junction resolvase-like predicted endonuclease